MSILHQAESGLMKSSGERVMVAKSDGNIATEKAAVTPAFIISWTNRRHMGDSIDVPRAKRKRIETVH